MRSPLARPRGPRRDERISSFVYTGHFPFVGAEFYPPALFTALSGRTPVGAGVPDGPLGLETYYYNDKPAHLRAKRGSGSDKRRTGDSLYDDLHRFGSRAARGGSFQRTSTAQEVLKPAVSSSLFWSLLGLRPKVTRARGRGTLPSEKMNGPSGTPAPTKCMTGTAAKCHGQGRTPPLQNANIPPRAQQKRDGRCRVRLFLSHLLSTPASPPDTPSAR